MSSRKSISFRHFISSLVLSLISGFMLFGGLLAILVVLPLSTSTLTTFPGILLLFCLVVVFSFVIYQLLPPENPLNELVDEI